MSNIFTQFSYKLSGSAPLDSTTHTFAVPLRLDHPPHLCGNGAPKDAWGFEHYNAVQKELTRISIDSKHLEYMTNFMDLHTENLIVKDYRMWVIHENNSCVDNENEVDRV